MRLLTPLALSTFVATGCSVALALSGSEDPNLAILAVGQSRAVVIEHLGEPASTTLRDGGRTDVFDLEEGNEPSSNRAWGHAVLDVLTLGINEIVSTPGELMMGEEIEVIVHYGLDDIVTGFVVNRPEGELK